MTENGSRAGVIVCGIDGSSGSRLALREAIRIAARRSGSVRAVAVYEPPEAWAALSYGAAAALPIPDAETVRADELAAARTMVDEVLEETAEDVARPEVSVEARPGRPAEVLVDLAAGADELVVGHRGRGAFGSLMLGSVGLSCVLHAACPVTIVPEPVST